MATRFWRESERRVDPYWSAPAGDQVASMSLSNTVNWWRGEFPSFGEACEVGSFSLLGREGQYVDRPVQRKYLIGEIPREPLWDLNHGYNAAIRRDWTQIRGSCDLLSWIIRNADKVSQPSSSQKEGAEVESHGLERSVPDFACNRSLVALILRTPFSEKAWQFKACRFRGIVHLQHLVTEEEREHRLRVMMNPWEDRMTYWGLKFPQYMTSSEPDGASEEEAVLSETEEYEVVVRNCLGSHKLLMNATMKAVDPRFEPGSTKGYVVFRTNRVLATHKQRFIFESHKLLEWWAYSVPIGVPRVMCGFRDDSGLVRTVEEFQVQKIPERAKAIWSDEVCLRFCDQLLWFVKEHVEEDDGRTVYHFEYQPSLGKIVCTRLADPEESAVLPNWYLQGFNPTL